MGFLEDYLSKEPLKITASDIENFIHKRLEENLNLEYTSIDTFGKPAQLTKEITAFANSAGGLLLLGVEEERRKNQSFPKAITWGDSSLSKERLENLIIGNIQPNIKGLRIIPVRNAERNGIIFLIDVPQSDNPPHMAADKRHYKRLNFEAVPMEHYELARLFSRNQTIRREHGLRLVGEPLASVMGSVPFIHNGVFLSVWQYGNKIVNRRADFHETTSPEQELFLSHLKTGYNQIYQDILDYSELYNKLAERSIAIYYSVIDELKLLLANEANRTTMDYFQTAQALSQEVNSVIERKNQPNVRLNASGPPPFVVMLGGQQVLSTIYLDSAEKIEKFFRSLFEGEAIGKMNEVWLEAQPLEERRTKIYKELQKLKTFVQEGVLLDGFCPAGKQAGYE